MKRGNFLVVASVLMLAACSQPVDDAGLPPSEVQETSSDVFWFEDGSVVEGSRANLTTDPSGGTLSLYTTGLSAGHAYTLWWAIFNHPEACSAACGEDDVFVDGDPMLGPNFEQIEAVGVSVVFGTGQIVDESGTATFTSQLDAGDVRGEREVVLGPQDGPAGLLEPMTAEVHAIVRSHGPPIQGHVDEQVGSFGGGCTPETGGNLASGNDCFDPQYTILIQ